MTPLHILYAEDDPWLVLSVREMLEEEGWRVNVYENGRAALDEIESGESYDLLLLDNNLPGVSGLELVRRARALSHRRETAIIIISGSEVGREALLAGADLFLKKPENICAIVGHVLRLTRRV
ncbi:MAG TPA: response regulator [Pyrinomonadaceae bacterium]|jgi:DNA-binding response OmpR family regulator